MALVLCEKDGHTSQLSLYYPSWVIINFQKYPGMDDILHGLPNFKGLQ